MGDTLLPPRCTACQAALADPGAPGLGRYACNRCMALFQEQPKVRCRRCGLALGPRPQAFGWTHCRHCRPLLQDPECKPLDCVVCCDYTPPFDQWIALLKYGNNPGLARFMAHWMALELTQSDHELPDVLVPVPSSMKRLKQRGYNQAALIAMHLGDAIARPVEKCSLIKVREAGAQAELDRRDRLKNLQGAFQATRAFPARLHIGLVDDVITTGATTQSCVEALYKAGAQRITILAICRTPE
ncbi:MAG TPA: ComF family protein [Limnobacter sp.]|nr:ComF family protein [Limnobacter sp.]